MYYKTKLHTTCTGILCNVTVDVSDFKPKCSIFLEVPGLKTEKKTVFSERKLKNAEIKKRDILSGYVLTCILYRYMYVVF